MITWASSVSSCFILSPASLVNDQRRLITDGDVAAFSLQAAHSTDVTEGALLEFGLNHLHTEGIIKQSLALAGVELMQR